MEYIKIDNLIITKNLISQAIYKKVLGDLHDPSIYKNNDYPVHNITQVSDIYLFCNKFSEMEYLPYHYEAWKTPTGFEYHKTQNKGIRLLSIDEYLTYKHLLVDHPDFSEFFEDGKIGDTLLQTSFRVCLDM